MSSYQYSVGMSPKFSPALEALAKEAALSEKAKEARSEVALVHAGVKAVRVTLKNDQNATEAQLRTIFNDLTSLNEILKHAVAPVKERYVQTQASVLQLPIISRIPVIRTIATTAQVMISKDTREIKGRSDNLEALQSDVAAGLKHVEARRDALKDARVASALTTLSKTLPANTDALCTFPVLKDEIGKMDVRSIYVNGKKQSNLKELFESLNSLFGIPHDDVRINDHRVAVFDKQGAAPANFSGDTRDLQALMHARPSQFTNLVSAYDSYCRNKDEFWLMNSQGFFFVPAKEDHERSVSFAKKGDGSIEITLKTKIALLRNEGDESGVATVTLSQVTTLAPNGAPTKSEYTFGNIVPTMNINAADLRRLQKQYPEKAEVSATASAATSN